MDQAIDDTKLMARVRAGDELAFELLFRRYEARLYAYLWRRVRDEELAADLTQETFVRLWQSRLRWQDSGSMGAYLIRTAQRLTIDEYRRREVRNRWSQDAAVASASAVRAPDQDLEERELRLRLDEAICALPERTREVFILKRDAGLSYREIAELMEISPKTVDAHMNRALRQLRDRLADLR